jgi:hypothetical protein
MTILDGLGRPWRVIPIGCWNCKKKSTFTTLVHIPDNDFDRSYCPKCFKEMNIGGEGEEE